MEILKYLLLPLISVVVYLFHVAYQNKDLKDQLAVSKKDADVTKDLLEVDNAKKSDQDAETEYKRIRDKFLSDNGIDTTKLNS